MKIIDKINSLKGKTFFSFEFFPPRTDEVVMVHPTLMASQFSGVPFAGR